MVPDEVVFCEKVDPAVSVIVVAWGSAPHLFECLASLGAQRTATAFEVVLVLNDVGRDVAEEVARRVRGANVLAPRTDLGFAGAVNFAARSARGDMLVVVQDDVEAAPDCLDRLVASARSHPAADVIGCAVVAPPGTSFAAVSEVASHDGGVVVSPGGPGEPVDVSPGAFAVRRATWDRLGGLDEIFHPCGFVTADLCARVSEAGGDVRVEPRASVRRLRSSRPGERFRSFVLALNGELFALRHPREGGIGTDRARSTEPPASGSVASRPASSGVEAPGAGPTGVDQHRVLIIDDSVPAPSLGAGSGRMADVARELIADGGFAVDVVPRVARRADDPARARSIGVEVVDRDLGDLIGPGGRHYGIVIVSRPHNWAASIETLRRLAPGVPVVYDAEALFHRRLERQLRFVIDAPTAVRVGHDAARMAAIEREIAREADYVVAISEEEADFFRANSPTPRHVAVHPPFFPISRPTPAGLGRRRDIGFVAGWSAGSDSPNADALAWFARHVLPKVRARVPGSRLRVTGTDLPANVGRLASPAIEFVGQLDGLEDFYASVRVVVVPVRYGSGVKLKTVEAIQYGVPTVATTVGAEGIPFDKPDAVCVADDPDEFAADVASLLDDDGVWQSQREKALAQQASWAARPSGPLWSRLVTDLVAGPAGEMGQ
jgi:GT2 family glycosyltransferase/glycosyltransferase involved in cell wall biosynthesis